MLACKDILNSMDTLSIEPECVSFRTSVLQSYHSRKDSGVMAESYAGSASLTDKESVRREETLEEDTFVDVETKSWSQRDILEDLSGG